MNASKISLERAKSKQSKAHKPKKKLKNTHENILAPVESARSQIGESFAHTESEVDVQKPELICVIHKGPVKGSVYVCPHCDAMYCENCVNALKTSDEPCWVCHNKFP